jgi:hypothetical protein
VQDKIVKAVEQMESAIAEILLENYGIESQGLSEISQDKSGVTTGKVKAQDGKTYKFSLDKEGSEVNEE